MHHLENIYRIDFGAESFHPFPFKNGAFSTAAEITPVKLPKVSQKDSSNWIISPNRPHMEKNTTIF